MKSPIKLFLFTGFLGAGKTTFLQRVIDGLQGHKIGIIMNEFGSISVDGTLLREQGMDVCELNNGSVFCSCMKGDFIEALVNYSQLPIEYLFVESSGMADPSNVESLLNDVIGYAKGDCYEYCGAICVIDAVNFLDEFDVLMPIERQILAASYIVINKTDLVGKDTIETIEGIVTRLNPLARVVKTSYCNIDFHFVKKSLQDVQQKAIAENHPKVSMNTPSTRPVSHTIRLDGVFDGVGFRRFLEGIMPWALRIKGFFHLSTGWHKVDVSGMQLVMEPTEVSRELSELVIISNKGLPALQEIYKYWDENFAVEMELK